MQHVLFGMVLQKSWISEHENQCLSGETNNIQTAAPWARPGATIFPILESVAITEQNDSSCGELSLEHSQTMY